MASWSIAFFEYQLAGLALIVAASFLIFADV